MCHGDVKAEKREKNNWFQGFFIAMSSGGQTKCWEGVEKAFKRELLKFKRIYFSKIKKN